MVSKPELRRRLRAARRAMPPEQRASASAATADLCHGRWPGELASYAAMADELDLGRLHAARWSAGRHVLLPRVIGPGRLAWHAVASPEQLRPGAYGIAEPDPARCPAAELRHGAVVLVPGIGFTADGRRLGQGGGFYDRLLAERSDLCAIGVGFACQLLDDLPCENHDARLRGLVIDGRVILEP